MDHCTQNSGIMRTHSIIWNQQCFRILQRIWYNIYASSHKTKKSRNMRPFCPLEPAVVFDSTKNMIYNIEI